jgi:hypothetical protein
MTTGGPGDAKARDALLRESKDLVAIEVIELCRELHIRAMLGGGPVLNANGLISPVVSKSVAILVDPASYRHLRLALMEQGWWDSTPRRARILPSARLAMKRDNELAGLVIYPFIPGFFADPEETFDIIWERHKEVPLRGHVIRALGRINSAILASHDGLDGRASRARNNFEYFVAQFTQVLSDQERDIAIDIIRRTGGCAEMNRLILALGGEPCPFALPSVSYVQWRLQISDVSDQARRAVAMLELGPEGRRLLYASRSGRPSSFAEGLRAALRVPRTVIDVFGARSRWARSFA